MTSPTLIVTPGMGTVRVFTTLPGSNHLAERWGPGVLLRLGIYSDTDNRGAEIYLSDENITQLIHALTEPR